MTLTTNLDSDELCSLLHEPLGRLWETWEGGFWPHFLFQNLRRHSKPRSEASTEQAGTAMTVIILALQILVFNKDVPAHTVNRDYDSPTILSCLFLI